jgi:hypothetical protein
VALIGELVERTVFRVLTHPLDGFRVQHVMMMMMMTTTMTVTTMMMMMMMMMMMIFPLLLPQGGRCGLDR